MPSARHILAGFCVVFFTTIFARTLIGAIRDDQAPLIAFAACGLAGCLITAGILLHVARWNRRFHSLHCPECNYDIHVTPHRCPECGWESTHVDSELQPFLVASAWQRSRESAEAKR
jgi:hypothetical protein